METPHTRYAKTLDGVNIAFQVRGNGPVDLIYARGWTQNFEIELEGPRSGAWFSGLASFSRLILFDVMAAPGTVDHRVLPMTASRGLVPRTRLRTGLPSRA